MNEKDQHHSGLYIPPHNRNRAGRGETNFSNRNTLFAVTQNNTSYRPQKFTTHAQERQNQREISSEAIQTVCKSGREMVHHESRTYINESTQVVTGKDGTVITVLENKRNTCFDMLRNTQFREKKLLQKIKFNKKNDVAQCELAELYLSGALGNREVQKAHELLLAAANNGKGNSHAMCLLSQMYERGDLGIPDVKLANEWMEKAAD